MDQVNRPRFMIKMKSGARLAAVQDQPGQGGRDGRYDQQRPEQSGGVPSRRQRVRRQALDEEELTPVRSGARRSGRRGPSGGWPRRRRRRRA